jgi:hypothetical protein
MYRKFDVTENLFLHSAFFNGTKHNQYTICCYMSLNCLSLLSSSIKEYNYEIHACQTNLGLTKFIINSITIYVFK